MTPRHTDCKAVESLFAWEDIRHLLKAILHRDLGNDYLYYFTYSHTFLPRHIPFSGLERGGGGLSIIHPSPFLFLFLFFFPHQAILIRHTFNLNWTTFFPLVRNEFLTIWFSSVMSSFPAEPWCVRSSFSFLWVYLFLCFFFFFFRGALGLHWSNGRWLVQCIAIPFL